MGGFFLRPAARRGLAGLFTFLISSSLTQAADIRVLSGMGMRAILTDLTGAFERSTDHKLHIVYDTAGLVRDRVRGGEATDVAIMQGYLFDTLQQGQSVREAPIALARSPIGLVARAGAQKHDIGSVDGLKRALLAAQSISYTDPANGGLSGSHFAKVLERLGIAEQMKEKTKLGKPMARVSSGEVEVAVLQISEILSLTGVQPLGPFPADLQDNTPVSAAIIATSAEPDASMAFIRFLTSPTAAKVIKAYGMEPIARE